MVSSPMQTLLHPLITTGGRDNTPAEAENGTQVPTTLPHSASDQERMAWYPGGSYLSQSSSLSSRKLSEWEDQDTTSATVIPLFPTD